jgi:hypothetical protein
MNLFEGNVASPVSGGFLSWSSPDVARGLDQSGVLWCHWLWRVTHGFQAGSASVPLPD